MSRTRPVKVDPIEAIALPPFLGRRDLRCAGAGPKVFFPGPGHGYEPARRLCAECPVLDECLSWALETGQEFGMWGGATPEERERMRPVRFRKRGRRSDFGTKRQTGRPGARVAL